MKRLINLCLWLALATATLLSMVSWAAAATPIHRGQHRTTTLAAAAVPGARAAAMAQLAPPPVTVTTTVGMKNDCAPTATLDKTAAGSVYYCYSFTNHYTATVTVLKLTDDGRSIGGLPRAVLAGETLQIISASPASAAPETRSTATWDYTTADATETFSKESNAATVRAVVFRKAVSLKSISPCPDTTWAYVPRGNPVYYCYTLNNFTSAPIRALTLLDDNQQTVVPWSSSGSELVASGESLSPQRTVVPSTPITSSAMWSIEAAGTAHQLFSNETAVQVVTATLDVALTVSGNAADCGTAALANADALRNYYCVKIKNNTYVTLTTHTVSVPALNLINRELSYVLAPQATLQVAASTPPGTISLPELAHQPNSPVFISTAYVTSTAQGENMVSGVSLPVTVTVSTTPVVVASVATNPDRCDGRSTTSISAGSAIFYCLVIRNRSSAGTALWETTIQNFSIPDFNLSREFQYNLLPGEIITLSYSTLPGFGLPRNALGPFVPATSDASVFAFYSARNPGVDYQMWGQSNSTSVNVTAHAATATAVQPTATFTPWPTFVYFPPTPTGTMLPAPPTLPPTLAPTITPMPSPTVIVFSTPGGHTPAVYPQIGPGGVAPQPQPQVAQGQLDQFAAATATAMVLFGYIAPGTDPAVALAAAQATAAAATATTAALYGYPAPGTDPMAAATATAAALSGYPAPGTDPMAAATATAMVASGFVAPGTDLGLTLAYAQGTATAQALANPTPWIDPAAAGTATAMALYGPGAPTTDPFVAATATALVASGLVAPGQELAAAGATATTLALYGPGAPITDPFVAATATALVASGLVAPGQGLAAAGATATTLAQYSAAPTSDPLAATATAVYLTSIAPPPQPLPTAPAQLTAEAAGTATGQALAAPISPLAPPAAVQPSEAEANGGPSTPAAPTGALPPAESAAQDTALGIFNRVLESAGATLAFIWFLVGSLIFFITAGVLAGLSFRRAENDRFTIVNGGEPAGYELDEPPLSKPTGDDSWPSSLP